MGLSEVAPPSAIDDEREEEPSSPIAAPQSYLNSFGQSSLSDEEPAEEPQFFSSLEEVEQPLPQEEEEEEEDEKEEEGDEKEENDKRAEDLEKINSGLFEDVRVGINQVYQDIVEEYGEEDGTLRRLLEDDAALEYGYAEDADDRLFEPYVEVDILLVKMRQICQPFGLYKGRVFPLEYTEDVSAGIDRMEEEAEYGVSADSFLQGVDMGQYLGEDYEDDRRAMLDDSVGKVEWAQDYVLRNATKRTLQRLARSKFFDAFADKDVVKEIIKKRTGSGKMKGGKFFLTDLFDMLRGRRVVEH